MYLKSNPPPYLTFNPQPVLNTNAFRFRLPLPLQNLPDDDLITALTTEAYKHSERARGIIRKILQERDVMLGDLPEPAFQRPAPKAEDAEEKNGSLFSATYAETPEAFSERAETIFKDRNLDPAGEEEYKRFDLDKNTGSTIKERGKQLTAVFLVLYVVFRIIRFLVENN